MSISLNRIFKNVSAGLFLLLILSCTPRPQICWVPEIESISAQVNDDMCRLTAYVKGVSPEEYEAGFYYGLPDEDMTKVTAEWDTSSRFISDLTSLQYDTDYVYKAYVGNGRNEVVSELGRFRSRSLSEEELYQNSMILPYHYKEVGRASSRFTMDVGGDAEFRVTIPSDADWISCQDKGRLCLFFVDDNDRMESRSVDVVFHNLADGQSDTLVVCQFAAALEDSRLPSNSVVFSHAESYYYMTIDADPDISVEPLSDSDGEQAWVSCGAVTDEDCTHSTIFFRTQENTSDEDRTCRFVVTYYGFDSIMTVTQKACNAIIEFEDTLVELLLVDAYDMDNDGRLSYYEAAQMIYLDPAVVDFSGMDIKSFDELVYFTNVEVIGTGMFAGSKLESIRFPGKLQILVDDVFENCTELNNVDLSYIFVGPRLFRGCTSIEHVKGIINGSNAFEGCVNLRTVVQQCTGVMSQTFLNCTNLQVVEFQRYSEFVYGIQDEAFRGCVSLPSIDIPDYVTEIQDRAFYGCSSLAEIHMEPPVPPVLGDDVFAGTSPDLKIYVRAESLSKYQAAWPQLADRIIASDR